MLKNTCHKTLYRAYSSSASSWTVSTTITDKKSVFTGRAIRISSESDAKEKLNDLWAEKSMKKATHQIYAWKSGSEGGFDNGGEAPGGSKLMELLSKQDNVLVLVTRWYGGVSIGGARFRHIVRCGQEALTQLE
ncbi:IMPACT family member [Yarrowia sp. B02]|nr:IMPACT family member [Yarrowia sp. B02]